MQATELYELGCRAYEGDRGARREWLARVARLAMPIAAKYGVLPGLFAAKAALESGYASDKYEEDFYEPQFGVKMARKAQNHNNFIGMNAFPDNIQFLPEFPQPRWLEYKTTFLDYGPHYHSDHIELTPNEPWMEFKSIEDCCEAWCANMRYQAQKSRKPWGMTIEEQLLAIESYTPEGSQAEAPGMHYAWQDYVLYLYKDYDLYAYDREAYGMTVKMTQENLDAHIKKAYEYAHMHCHYAPCVTYPPMENGCADCSGLAFKALDDMGYMESQPFNIDDIPKLCERAGMKKSTDINDAWRRHGVVCMQDKNNAGTNHVNHVYYSLGGTSVNSISKYDLGSDKRIQSDQPFNNVPVNEWKEQRDFLCVFFADDAKRKDIPDFDVTCEYAGTVHTKAGIYSGPGTDWRKVGGVSDGDKVFIKGLVTNDQGLLWYAVRHKDVSGYVSAGAVAKNNFITYKGSVDSDDGTLALRVAPCVDAPKIKDIKNGTTVMVDNVATAPDGGKWYHVRHGKLRGFVSAMWVK